MFNSEQLKKIGNMSDDMLREKLSAVLGASGENVKGLDLSSENLEKIRNVVSGLGEEEINKIMSSVPPEKINEIKKNLSE
jgi:hypothetical protein